MSIGSGVLYGTMRPSVMIRRIIYGVIVIVLTVLYYSFEINLGMRLFPR